VTNYPAPSIQSNATTPAPATTFKPRVRRLGPGRYLVESASRPGVGHPVTIDRCNCPGYSYRGTCKHIVLVQAISPRMEAWYSQATPVTPAAPAVGAKFRQRPAPASSVEAELAAAARVLAIKRRALADADPQSDERAGLLRQVDQAERAVAALDASAMRAA